MPAPPPRIPARARARESAELTLSRLGMPRRVTRADSACQGGSQEPTRRGSGSGDGDRETGEVPEPGDLRVHELRPAPATDHDDLVAVEPGGGVERDVVVGLRLQPARPLEVDEVELVRRRAGAVHD